MLGKFFSENKALSVLWLASIGLLLFLFIGELTSSYRECSRVRQTFYSRNGGYGLLEKIQSFVYCEGVTGNANAELITALATIFLGAFTLTLWLTSDEQARLTRKSIDLAREEFISTHRPKIILREAFIGTFTEGTSIAVFFQLANIGETLGKIVLSEIRAEVVRKDSHRLLLHPSLNTQAQLGIIQLAPGQAQLFKLDTENCPKWNAELFQMKDGTRIAVIHIVGQLIYTDEFDGIRRRTAFRRELAPERQRFYRLLDEPDLDYAD